MSCWHHPTPTPPDDVIQNFAPKAKFSLFCPKKPVSVLFAILCTVLLHEKIRHSPTNLEDCSLLPMPWIHLHILHCPSIQKVPIVPNFPKFTIGLRIRKSEPLLDKSTGKVIERASSTIQHDYKSRWLHMQMTGLRWLYLDKTAKGVSLRINTKHPTDSVTSKSQKVSDRSEGAFIFHLSSNNYL